MGIKQFWQKRRARKEIRNARELKGFRRWRKTRPFYAGLFTLLGGSLVISGPLSLLRFSMLPKSTIWEGLTVGGFIIIFGFLEWFAPYYALLTGLMTLVLSLVSLIVALGGLLIGMIFGLVGGALAVAWKPIQPIGSQPVQPALPISNERSAPM